jgi:hypothetical protein
MTTSSHFLMKQAADRRELENDNLNKTIIITARGKEKYKFKKQGQLLLWNN